VGVMSLEIQRHITSIYDGIDQYYNNKGLPEICYWRSRRNFKRNEAFQVAFAQMEEQLKLVTKNLNQLSESIDDFEIYVNQCKRLILLETEKDQKFASTYNRYHVKLNREVNASKG
jgi:hypothetical protein